MKQTTIKDKAMKMETTNMLGNDDKVKKTKKKNRQLDTILVNLNFNLIRIGYINFIFLCRNLQLDKKSSPKQMGTKT